MDIDPGRMDHEFVTHSAGHIPGPLLARCLPPCPLSCTCLPFVSAAATTSLPLVTPSPSRNKPWQAAEGALQSWEGIGTEARHDRLSSPAAGRPHRHRSRLPAE